MSGQLEKHFDDLMHVYRARTTALTQTTQTVEIDLDLPRGFIAKIKQVVFKLDGQAAISAGETYQVNAALVNDSDDITSIQIPANTIKHDVICDYTAGGNYNMGITYNDNELISFQDKMLDVVSARNLRFNAADNINATTININIECVIWYTLEKVTQQILMEALDIL